MYNIDFNNKIHVHFIGIGGISMSGLAELLHKKGFTVSGSDEKKSNVTSHLEQLGINIAYTQTPKNINPDIKLVVYTAAIKEDNPELVAAKAAGIHVMERACLLGQLMLNYKDSIGIAGTHGKTTTTSMLSLILIEAGFDPTVAVGGILKGIGGNIRIGSSQLFVVESCEYTNSFLKFFPKHEIILNIEAEHLDFFKDLSDIRQSFKKFAQKLSSDGTLIINGNIENYEEITKDLICKVITYGVADDKLSITKTAEKFDFFAANISFDKNGFGSYDLYAYDKFIERINLKVIGIHNISNSVAALALALTLGVPSDKASLALASFTGTNRRFEHKGELNGIQIIDDYAHHPTEIHATLSAAKACPHQKLWVVFQPHTYSRTKMLLDDIANALLEADEVVLAPIYAAREKNPGDISSLDIVKKLEKLGKKAVYIESFDEIKKYLLSNCNNGDMLITMGAGDIVNIGEELLRE